MVVEHCICHKITFKDIQKTAAEKSISSVGELQKENICCTNCKLCVPYVELMLKTGVTTFEAGAIYALNLDP
jgi:bacterioferritin-associated ferredoxin